MFVLAPVAVWAQGADFGVTATGLVSIQPVDDAYVGGPYLNEGIGGSAPGFGAAASVIASNGFTVAVEFSTARFAREQAGRLVPGGSGTTRLHDSLLSFLAGFAQTTGKTRVQFLLGGSALLDSPTVNGTDVKALLSDSDSVLPIQPTGGIDVFRSIFPRSTIVVGARYAYLERAENLRYLGIGPHLLRIGAGIRIRLH